MLIFPRGGIEADPEFMPNADGEFHHWSRSLKSEACASFTNPHHHRRGVIALAAMKNPITWFRKERPDRQRLAFVYQLSRQLLSGKTTLQSCAASHILGEQYSRKQPRTLARRDRTRRPPRACQT
ncbi:MAG: hypothetical protein U0X92_12385 [Anaerolineales bacterium]